MSEHEVADAALRKFLTQWIADLNGMTTLLDWNMKRLIARIEAPLANEGDMKQSIKYASCALRCNNIAFGSECPVKGASMPPRIVVVRDQSWQFTAFRKDGVLFWMWTRGHGYDKRTGGIWITVAGMPVFNA